MNQFISVNRLMKILKCEPNINDIRLSHPSLTRMSFKQCTGIQSKRSSSTDFRVMDIPEGVPSKGPMWDEREKFLITHGSFRG